MPAPGVLVIDSANGATLKVPLDRDRFVLGRAPEVDLAFPEDLALSRRHLAIAREGNGWSVEDLNSKNGTLLNGTALTTKTLLKATDVVVAGHQSLYLAPAGSSDQTVIFADEVADTATTQVVHLEAVLEPGMVDSQVSGTAGANPQTRALIRAGRELSSHRPLAELFELILTLAVDAVSARQGVLLTLENDETVLRANRGEKFRISTKVRDRVLKGRESLLIRDAQLDADFRDQMSIVERHVRSMVAVPLQTDTKVLGLIYVDSPMQFREFTRDDLNLLTVLANVAAIRIEHARLAEVEAAERAMDQELQQAAGIQQRLLPTKSPTLPGWDLAGRSMPCRGVGGDYFDYLPRSDGHLTVMVGDVAGKGMPAALLVSSLQARAHVLFEEPGQLSARLARLNKAVCSNCPDNRFITLFTCVIDPATGVLTYGNAGHNPPILVRASGGVELLDTAGMLLGVLPMGTYQEKTVQMEPGDTLVLYSDGVSEANNPAGEEFGEDRLGTLAEVLRQMDATAMTNRILESVASFAQGVPAADDATIVVIRRNA